jgi:uncharacterized iron-regulated membrane protein
VTAFRKVFFWLHLGAGLIAGLVVAVMSFTGATIAFEKDFSAWAERDVRIVAPPIELTQHLPLSDVLARAREQEPETRPSGLAVSADPAAAIAITFGRDHVYYANPYTGEIRKPSSTRLRDFLHLMESWHRFLGFSGESSRPIGKAITGACNLAFLFLAVSGLYLWWPRSWSWRGVKAVAIFNFRLIGKARDFNWHNSVGLWTAPILIVLTLTAVPMSYRWGNNLIYRLTGTELPTIGQGSGPGATGLIVTVPTPEPGTKLVSQDALLASVQAAYPGWTDITFRLGNARGPSGNKRREGQPDGENRPTPSDESRERHAETGGEQRPRGPQSVNVTVRTAKQWPLFATTTLALDPFTGAVLKKETFADQNAGRRLRAWARFLHTGEALGFIGKLLAVLASLGALALVWTGFALSWRRFFRRKTQSKVT